MVKVVVAKQYYRGSSRGSSTNIHKKKLINVAANKKLPFGDARLDH